MNIRAMHLGLLLVIMGLGGCEKKEAEPPPEKLTYADDVATILGKDCVECHVAGQRGAVESGLLMVSYESLMKGSSFGPVVNPGSAMTSSLYVVCYGKDRLEVKMPHGKDALSTEEIQTIRAWIENGAAKN